VSFHHLVELRRFRRSHSSLVKTISQFCPSPTSSFTNWSHVDDPSIHPLKYTSNEDNSSANSAQDPSKSERQFRPTQSVFFKFVLVKSLHYKKREDTISELEVLDKVMGERCGLELLLSCGVLASAFGWITSGLEGIALAPVFLLSLIQCRRLGWSHTIHGGCCRASFNLESDNIA
jgi:hypothetical protein